jgi:hypothetical protein
MYKQKRRGRAPKAARASKKARTSDKDRPVLSEPQHICALTAEINQLEAEIATKVKQFANVRAQMIAGIATFEGIQNRDKIDDLSSRLAQLKTQRTEALGKVDTICSGVVGQPRNPSAYVTKGGCPGGCLPGNLSYWAQGCLDICSECGSVYQHYESTMEGVNYSDMKFMDFSRRRSGGYKPPNHFAEIIAQFQGKRRASTPPDIMQVVSDYCRRYGFPKHKITPQVVRMFLKQKQQEETTFRKYSKGKSSVSAVAGKGGGRKYTDYYKQCAEIAWRLSGIPPPYMTPSQEDRIIALFPLVVEAYKTSPRYLTRKADRTNRKNPNPNLLNYHYVFFKEAQLLGYEEFLPYIALPKSTANIDDNDEAGWRHVCAVNGWTYLPTR